MTTPTERAYQALHDDYTNDLITRAEYLAAFKRLKAPARRRLLAWLFVGAVVLALLALYAVQVGAL